MSHEDSVDDGVLKIESGNGHAVVLDGPDDEDEEPPGYPWEPPTGILAKIWWLCFFPVNLLLFLTIPDVRYGDSIGRVKRVFVNRGLNRVR